MCEKKIFFKSLFLFLFLSQNPSSVLELVLLLLLAETEELSSLPLDQTMERNVTEDQLHKQHQKHENARRTVKGENQLRRASQRIEHNFSLLWLVCSSSNNPPPLRSLTSWKYAKKITQGSCGKIVINKKADI